MRLATLATVWIASLVPWLGCASEPPERRAAFDPSNPRNGESAAPPVASKPAEEPSATPAGHHHGEAAQVYQCPMHEDVRQATPGQCPKCGMTLVPRAGGHPSADGGH
jgi:hypothetical protein